MAKANESPASEPSVPGSAPAARPGRRRLLVALALLVVSAGAAVGIWVYRAPMPPAPTIPEIELAGVDPEVADAITAAREAVLKEPRSAAVWGRLGMTLHAHGYRNEALVCYSAASLFDDDESKWPYLQGVIRRGGTEPETALPFFERAVDRASANSPARLALAEMLVDLSRFDEASGHYQRVLQADPQNARAVLGLALVAIGEHRYEDSLKHLNAVADSPFVQKRACVLRAAGFKRLGDATAEERERQRLAKLPEDQPWPDPVGAEVQELTVGVMALLERSKELMKHGQRVQGLQVLRLATQRYPQDAMAWLNLGQALGFVNDFAAAEQALLKCVALAPNRGEPWRFLGGAQQAQGKFGEAVKSFRKAIELHPSEALVHLNLGDCLLALEDRPGAADAYLQALRYRPDLLEARQKLDKLAQKK